MCIRDRTHFFDAAVYLMKGKEGWFLIDCGTPEGYEQIKENVKKTGVDPAEIRFILGTHGHYDHVGAAHLWKQEFGCLLYLHELDREQAVSYTHLDVYKRQVHSGQLRRL